MPIATIQVLAVYSHPIKNDLQQFSIVAKDEIYTTLDQWKAAVANESMKTGQRLKVWSQDTKFGQRLVSVELVDAEPKEAA